MTSLLMFAYAIWLLHTSNLHFNLKNETGKSTVHHNFVPSLHAKNFKHITNNTVKKAEQNYEITPVVHAKVYEVSSIETSNILLGGLSNDSNTSTGTQFYMNTKSSFQLPFSEELLFMEEDYDISMDDQTFKTLTSF